MATAHMNMCVWDYTSPCLGARCPRRQQCEAAKQTARANNNGGNGNNNRHHNHGGNNNRRHNNNGNNSGNSNRRMPMPPPYHGPQGANVTVNNITVNYNYNAPAQTTEDNTVLGWLQGKIAGILGGRSAAEAMFRGQLPPNA